MQAQISKHGDTSLPQRILTDLRMRVIEQSGPFPREKKYGPQWSILIRCLITCVQPAVLLGLQGRIGDITNGEQCRRNDTMTNIPALPAGVCWDWVFGKHGG